MHELSFTNRLLNRIQRAGNRLPDPVVVFLYLAVAIVIASWLASYLNLSATHPVTQEVLYANNLLNAEGIRQIISQAVSNFTGFAPVGVVLVVMLGIGIAEHSGLIAALVKRLVARSSPKHIAYWVSFAGILSSLGADVGYVVLIPLAGVIYFRSGRPALAGIAVAFASVSAGFSANLFLGPVDVMLAGISSTAAQFVDTGTKVAASDNYYFIVASTFLLTFICGWLSNNVIEPRLQLLGKKDQPTLNEKQSSSTETGTETNNTKLWPVALFSLIFMMGILAATLINSAPFYSDDEPFSLLLRNIVPLLAIYFGISGYVYGRFNGVYSSLSDSVEGMVKAMQTMAYYIVLMFFAAQFVSYFSWSNLGIIFAISGANGLSELALPTTVILLLMITVSALINLLIGSASAKWTLLAPVFVPMLMLLGIAPEHTQMAYRIGDSSTNIITPLMPYFGIVLAYAQHYQKDLGLGDIISTMIPYSFALFCVWSLLFLTWVGFGIPLGP